MLKFKRILFLHVPSGTTDIICRGSKEETSIFYDKIHKRFKCKDEIILNPNNALSFLGFDIKCVDYDPQDIEHEKDMINDEGKVRIVTMDQEVAISQFYIIIRLNRLRTLNNLL